MSRLLSKISNFLEKSFFSDPSLIECISEKEQFYISPREISSITITSKGYHFVTTGGNIIEVSQPMGQAIIQVLKEKKFINYTLVLK